MASWWGPDEQACDDLYMAAHNGQELRVRELLHAFPTLPPACYQGALSAAVRHPWPQVVHELLSVAVPLDLAEALRILVAYWRDDAQMVLTLELLKYAGADIHQDDDEALCQFAADGNATMTQLFLEQGSDPNAQQGQPLARAVRGGHVPVVRLLLTYGADVRQSNDLALYTLTISAPITEQETTYTLLRLLLAAGADIHASNDRVICWAVSYGADDPEQLLLRTVIAQGGDVHARNDLPIQIAVLHGSNAAIDVLMNAGADVPPAVYADLEAEAVQATESTRRLHYLDDWLAQWPRVGSSPTG